MPNTQSAKRALRKSEVRRLRNRSRRSALRGTLKKARTAAKSENREEAVGLFREAVRQVDKAAAAKLLHKNTAARIKSRLTAYYKKHDPTTAQNAE